MWVHAGLCYTLDSVTAHPGGVSGLSEMGQGDSRRGILEGAWEYIQAGSFGVLTSFWTLDGIPGHSMSAPATSESRWVVEKPGLSPPKGLALGLALSEYDGGWRAGPNKEDI